MDSYQIESMNGDDFVSDDTSRNQTDDNAAISPIELTNSTGTCLEKLNEDCLLEIFSCNSLTLFDLLSLAETCTRFKQITQRVFPKDYAIVCELFRLGFEYKFRSKNCWIPSITPQTIERILKHFGLHLSEFIISSFYSNYQNIVNLVGKYCGAATVKNLEISEIENLDDIIGPLDSIFQRVQKLTMDRCNFIRTLPWSVLNSSSLIELNIITTSGCVEILECTFPNLERFTWWFSAFIAGMSVKNCDILHKFIRRHDHLKSIGTHVCCNELLNVIDSKCKELEELISHGMEEYRPSTSGSLSKLKVLDVSLLHILHEALPYIPLLKVAKSLEIMKMTTCYEIPVQIFDVLSQLENLREFHFGYGSVDCIPWSKLAQLRKVIIDFRNCYPCNITNMIEQLINLEELECKGTGSIFYGFSSEKDFLKICKIVERREHVLTIKCKLSLELKKYCDDNRRVKLINV